MKKLAIIIVNYNTKDALRGCLKNLQTLGLSDTKIVVVDNASKDGSAEMVGAEFRGVNLIRTENRGLAAGYNLGIKASQNPDYYLFLGTDAFPKLGCIEGAVDFMEANKSVGAATCKLVLRNESLDMDAHRGFPTPWAAFTHFSGLEKLFPQSKLFGRYFLGYQNMSTWHEIDLCISHFMMVKREIFDKIGLWDEDFFVYGEDVDLCWRIKQGGYKIYYLPQFECLHYKGVGVGIRKETADISKVGNATRSRMKKETTRAMQLFYKKHMYKKYPWILNKLVGLGIHIMEKVRSSLLPGF